MILIPILPIVYDRKSQSNCQEAIVRQFDFGVGLHYILDKGRKKIAGKGKDRYCYSAETKQNGGSKSCHEYNNTRNEIPEHSGKVCPR